MRRQPDQLTSVPVDVLDEHRRPVGQVEDDEEDGDQDLADVLNLKENVV